MGGGGVVPAHDFCCWGGVGGEGGVGMQYLH